MLPQILLALASSAAANSNKPKEPIVSEINPETQGLINDQIERAKADPGPNVGLMGAEAGIAHDQHNSPQSSAATGSDPAYTQALKNQYYGKAKREIDSLRSQSGIQDQMDKANKLKQASAAAMGQQQAKLQQYQFLTDAYNRQEYAKAGAINQLFQLGGYAMGQYVANNPGLFNNKPNTQNDYSTLKPDNMPNDYSTLR